jgi:hypothetical protein
VEFFSFLCAIPLVAIWAGLIPAAMRVVNEKHPKEALWISILILASLGAFLILEKLHGWRTFHDTATIPFLAGYVALIFVAPPLVAGLIVRFPYVKELTHFLASVVVFFMTIYMLLCWVSVAEQLPGGELYIEEQADK